MPDKVNPNGIKKEWFAFGERDFKAAAILFREGGYSDVVAVHLQQASEKYLKGYLISKGWHLKKTHDLRELLDQAIKLNQEFSEFLKLARQLTAVYIEERYPVGPPVDYSTEEISSLIKQTESLIDLIKHLP